MFTKQDKQDLIDQITDLKAEVRALRKERKAMEDDLGLLARVKELREQIETLAIEKERKQEEHEREKRDVTHMVGLEKKRQQFEIDQAKRETTVKVREENLAADQKRFEEQMKFQNKRFEEEVGYLKDLMVQVLERLPTVTVDKSIEQRQTQPRRRSA